MRVALRLANVATNLTLFRFHKRFSGKRGTVSVPHNFSLNKRTDPFSRFLLSLLIHVLFVKDF